MFLYMTIAGRQYDGKGRLREWWDPLTVSQFRKTTSCMKKQYDQYIIDGLHVSLCNSNTPQQKQLIPYNLDFKSLCKQLTFHS